MESRAYTVASKIDRKLTLKVIPGHFVTSHSHINTYIDVTRIKIHTEEAKIAAKYFADLYATTREVDTIVCLDGTQVIAAYLAQMLSARGVGNFNEGKDIHIVTPENDRIGNMLFRDNVQGTIYQQKLLILLGNGSTGTTADKCIDCINYYGGWVTGIGAIFSAVDMVKDLEINPLFTPDDLHSDYEVYNPADCPLCKNGVKMDAIVNSFGYSKF